MTRRSAAALVVLVGLLIVGLRASRQQADTRMSRPTILLTVDRTLWHRLGVSRLTYRRALAGAGARVRVLDSSALSADESADEVAARLVAGIDGLVLSGGGDVDPRLYDGDPATSLSVSEDRDRFELALLAAAEARALPVLGICRGSQLLNVARGGTLRTIRSDAGKRHLHGRFRGHAVDLEPGSRLAELLATTRLDAAVSYHGQAVARPGTGLVVVGRAEDGVIEAIEATGDGDSAWLIGVQWHPELSLRQRLQKRLFRGLVQAARRSRP